MQNVSIDLILRNGIVFCGTGVPPKQCDIAISGGQIVAIERSIAAIAHEERNLSGLWVLPGFIDIHTHYDIEVEISPGLSESVQQGVTTVVMGNCSLSVTYGEPSALADMFLRVETLPRVLIEKWLKKSISWSTPSEYLSHLQRLPLGPNVATLLGHSALRAHVMGLQRSLSEKATSDELATMERLAHEALEAGCIGISIDMVPWHMMSGEFKGKTIPSQHADFREYQMLAEVCRKRDAVFQVTPNPQDIRSVWAILWMSLGIIRRPLRVTILAALDSVAYPKMWQVFSPLLFLFNTIFRGNIRFQTLTEPFTVYSDGPLTPLFEEFPTGVQLNDQESREERLTLWSDQSFRDQFRQEWSSRWRNTFHRDLSRMHIVRCPDSSLVGKSFTDIANEKRADQVETFISLLEQYDTDLRWVSTGANDRPDIRLKLMRNQHILPGFTDAGAHVRNLGYYDGALSLLRQAVSTNFLPPEKAIARVTGEPATWFNIEGGVLRPGEKADIVIIDPVKIKSELSPQIEHKDPLLDGALRMVKRDAQEIVSVYIGGKVALSHGMTTPALGKEQLGEVLKVKKTTNDTLKSNPRNKVSDTIVDHPFESYWEIFVFKHQELRNVSLHFLGVLIIYGVLISVLLTRNPWLLFLMPLSQIVGLLGHRFFEPSYIDKRDAVFSLRALYCLNKMFFQVLKGEYFDEVRTVNDRLTKYLAQKELSSTKQVMNS